MSVVLYIALVTVAVGVVSVLLDLLLRLLAGESAAPSSQVAWILDTHRCHCGAVLSLTRKMDDVMTVRCACGRWHRFAGDPPKEVTP